MDKQSKMSMGFLLSAGLFLVILTIILAFGQNLIGDFQNTASCSGTVDDNQCNGCASGFIYNSTGNICHQATNISNTSTVLYIGDEAFNGSLKGQEGLTTIQSKTPLIALIVVVIVIIGLLLGIMKAKGGE